MSSIIACSSPDTSGASGTRCGVLPSSLIPKACASRFAGGSIVNTTTVRPYSAARSAIDAAVVVLPTPPAPQHTTTRLDLSDRIDFMSSAGGGVVLIYRTPAAQAFPPVRRDFPDPRRRRWSQFQSWHLQAVELLGALGPGLDPAGVFDGFGQQPGEVGVAQTDSRFLEPGAHRVGVDVALGAWRDRRQAGTAGCCG